MLFLCSNIIKSILLKPDMSGPKNIRVMSCTEESKLLDISTGQALTRVLHGLLYYYESAALCATAFMQSCFLFDLSASALYLKICKCQVPDYHISAISPCTCHL